MRILKALGLVIALVAAMFAVSTTSVSAAGGGFSCSGSGGTATFTPGLLLKTSLPQQAKASQGGLACTGGYVTAGKVVIKVATPDVRCSGLVNAIDKGTATATWSAPLNMGTSTLKMNLKVTSSTGHSTTGTLTGLVTTTGSNLASGKAVAGTFTLNKGLLSTGQGGDCSINSPLTSFGITALAFHTIG